VNRIRNLLALRDGRKLLIPFFTAGYPDLKTSLELVQLAEAAGADVVELGMPFSDPLADGPEIQYSSQVALQNGVGLESILSAVGKLREEVSIPLVLMGYYNPILAYDPDRFLQQASRRGVDGFIIPDLPIEEADDFRKSAEALGLSSIFLVAPTSSRIRIRAIDAACSDLVYAVTVTGVTGSGRRFDNSTDRYLKGLQEQLTHPFVAGFGVSSPESATRLARYADGVVIGSVLVQMLREAKTRAAALGQVGKFLRRVRRALD